MAIPLPRLLFRSARRLENATAAAIRAVVNNVVDFSQFRTFSEFPGRALTARIRLITSR